jgi:hypothetical protein
MSRSVRMGTAFAQVLLLLALAGCAKKVLVDPRVDLAGWGTIGIVEFSGGADPELGVQATHEFMEALQRAQPGVRILELGSEARVLHEVDSVGLDFEAARALGERYEIDALIIGRLEIERVKPSIRFGQSFASMEARADLHGELAARLIETDSGATVWTRSTTATANVAHVGVPTQGLPTFSAKDPSDASTGLVRQLVVNASHDFRPRWVKQSR